MNNSRMFGSLGDFIHVQLPIVDSKLPTQEFQQEQKSSLENMFKRRVISNFNEYQPSDKTHLLAKFNINQNQRKNNSFQRDKKKYHSQSERKNIAANTSFFAKNQITKDYIAKAQLKRRHNLLRAIVRTNQNDNSNEGVTDYDKSFKRLYDNFQSIYAKPILQYRNLVIEDTFGQMSNPPSAQLALKPVINLSHKKRIEYENCLSWAKKHKKKGEFYEQQLGKHLKDKKEESINQGHSLMPEVQRRLKNLSSSFRLE